MNRPVFINYQELDYVESHERNSVEGRESILARQKLPKLKDCVSSLPHDHEEEIAQYLKKAPGYSGMGKIVGDVLDPNAKVVLFPGTNTDGFYIWPTELAYYVRKYHIRIPNEFVARMESLGWKPPSEGEIDWISLEEADSQPP